METILLVVPFYISVSFFVVEDVYFQAFDCRWEVNREILLVVPFYISVHLLFVVEDVYFQAFDCRWEVNRSDIVCRTILYIITSLFICEKFQRENSGMRSFIKNNIKRN